MRKYKKNQCLELIHTLEDAHKEIIKLIDKHNPSAAAALLADCQDMALFIGDMVKESEGEETDAADPIEKYCGAVYQIYERINAGQAINHRKAEKQLKKAAVAVRNSIHAIPARYEAVFLPYKASMWDSLESIWLAADADPDCDAYVIPIPYYDKNPGGSFARIHYEGKDYPDYVPVTNYAAFNLEEHHPDMIYIHNPFDDGNTVTSVHPNYYSDRLKEYTDCLVYVPYWATTGKMSEAQAMCRAYLYADYIVVQNKEIISQFDKHIPREKFLPFGSPKFDRVIRLCENPPAPPAEWKEKMEGKRVYFYNTSLAGMLVDTGKFLQKMAYVFNTFKEVKDACILWRPHPLMESTFESMRQEYQFVYAMLRDAFIGEGIGIYDTTSDIEQTIAQCDAYIGDAGTSVISLFGVSGKPLYILNNTRTEPYPEDWWTGQFFYCPVDDERFDRCILMPENKLFICSGKDQAYHFLQDLPAENERVTFLVTLCMGNMVYVFPGNVEYILVLSIGSREIRKISLRKANRTNENNTQKFIQVIFLENEYAFLIPKGYPWLIRFDLKTEEIKYVSGITDFYFDDENGIRISCARILVKKKRKIVFTEPKGKKIQLLDVDSLELETINVDFDQTNIGTQVENPSGRYVWFYPYTGTTIIRWDMEKNISQKYDINVKGLAAYDRFQNVLSDKFYFSGAAFFDDYMILAPNWGNKFVKLDIGSGKCKEWNPPFPFETEKIDEWHEGGSVGSFIRGMDGRTVGFFNSMERTRYDVDFENNVSAKVAVHFEKDELRTQYGVGFTDEYEDVPYCLRESAWISLDDIARKAQAAWGFSQEEHIRAFDHILTTHNGECGNKIWSIMVQKMDSHAIR